MKIRFSPPKGLFLTACSTLFALVSTAQAGTWSAPVYNVSNRAPAQAGAEHANGGGGGSVGLPAGDPVVVDEAGPGASGTITATFTWTPDYVGEAAPEKVFVVQTGGAVWRNEGPIIRDPGGGPGGGVLHAPAAGGKPAPSGTPSPYAQGWYCDLSYTSESTDGVGGADDGLGDPEVALDAPAVGGVSSGTHVVVVTVGGGNGAPVTVTTPAVSLSASCAGENAMTSWSYSAQVAEPVMTCNGTTMSPDKQLQVMVGQHIAVAVSVPVPNTMPVTQQWTVPGDRIKNFAETTGDYAVNPVVPCTGHKVDLPAADLQQSGVSFYWYNGSFGGTSNNVTVQVTVDGKSITLTGKIKVFRPKFTSFTGQYLYDPRAYRDSPEMVTGISWMATVENPNIAAATGRLAYEQVVKLDGHIQGKEPLAPHAPYQFSLSSGGATWLDSKDEDARYGSENNAWKDIASGATETHGDNDEPRQATSFTDTAIQINHAFRTYLVYRPGDGNSDSIWVVLGYLDWKASYTAALDETPGQMPQWVVTPGTAENLTGVDDYQLPDWTDHTLHHQFKKDT